MVEWIRRILSHGLFTKSECNQHILALESQLQSFKLETEEKSQTVERLVKALDQQRETEWIRTEEKLEARLDRLAQELATPVAQMSTQIALFEKFGKQLPLKDVISVTRKLLTTLEDWGIQTYGDIGESAEYDPELQEPLSQNDTPKKGDRVILRIPGIIFNDVPIRKAGVEQWQGD